MPESESKHTQEAAALPTSPHMETDVPIGDILKAENEARSDEMKAKIDAVKLSGENARSFKIELSREPNIVVFMENVRRYSREIELQDKETKAKQLELRQLADACQVRATDLMAEEITGDELVRNIGYAQILERRAEELRNVARSLDLM